MKNTLCFAVHIHIPLKVNIITMYTYNNSLSVYLNKSIDILYLHKLNLATSAFEQLDTIDETLVVSSILVSFIVGSYFKTAIYCYMYDKRKEVKERPINILILIQAIIQHIVYFIMASTYTIGLGLDVTFSDHLGEAWCNLPWYGGAYGAAYKSIGGLGIAIFRLLFLFHGDWVKDKCGKKRLLSIILSISIVMSVLLTVGFGIGNGPSSRKQVTWNFCIGKSEEHREYLHDYSLLRGTVIPQDEFIPKLVLTIILFNVIVELVCYLIFFGYVYHHNRYIMKKKILEIKVIKTRQQKNAMTLMGQFYTFVVEGVLYLGMILSMKKESDIAFRMIVVVGFYVEFGLVSVVEVMTSRSLRKYLPHNWFLR